MRIVILGANGMLGSDLMAACQRANITTIGHDVDTLDISDPQQIKRLPVADWVVNCAAYTMVDEAQQHRDKAYTVNAEGARNVARICAKKRMSSLYISTDYVFDGTKREPYTETDRTNPSNIYGASKLAGEKAVRSIGGSYLIVRTQSLFGRNGPNFIKTIAGKLARGEEPLRVADDQVTAPTYTRHLAEAILYLLQADARGIIHVSASTECTWYDLAKATAEKVKPGARIEAIKTADLGLPAPRPLYAVLDSQKYRMVTGQVMPTWQQGLEEYLAEMEE